MLLACAPLASAAVPTELQRLDATVEACAVSSTFPACGARWSATGQIVFERGYGVRELGKPAPVEADTLFAIASNTSKARFAATFAQSAGRRVC